MIARLGDIWVYLAASPLAWLAATLLAFLLAGWISEKGRRHPLLNPVGLAVALLVALLTVTGTPYQTYFDGAQFVHFLLGPATVALAVPLFDNARRVRRVVLAMAAALVAGSATAILSAAGLAALLGADHQTVVSLAPKSATTPIAMGIAERLGGIPSLTAVLVIATGILGAMIAGPLLNLLGVRQDEARGFAIGLAAHGIGTARAFQTSELAGTFAGIALALNGLVTAVLAPALLTLVG